ncbi:MAG: hypothetical protein IPK62_02055 [Bacteroidetes bacterium]|nr:hypothetical protein [Bacteroidota bacterium]
MKFNIDIDGFKSDIIVVPTITNVDLSKRDLRIKNLNPDDAFTDANDFAEIIIDYKLFINSNKFEAHIPFRVKLGKEMDYSIANNLQSENFRVLYTRELRITKEILNKVNFTHELVLTLLLIKPTFNSYIGYSSYLNINSETFWANELPPSIDEESGVFDLVLIDECLKIQTADLKYKYERMIPKSILMLQLVPKDYSKPELKKEKLERVLIFQGSFKECFALFNRDSFIEKSIDDLNTKKENNERQRQSEESQEYYNKGYEEDYFNAVTGGQLGFYSDFDGDIDDIDTWSRG